MPGVDRRHWRPPERGADARASEPRSPGRHSTAPSRRGAAASASDYPARSLSCPPRTIEVAAARSGPGSRSSSRWRTRARTRASASRTPAPRSLAPGHREPQVERLGGDEQLDGEDPLDVLDDGPRVPRRDRAHRDVVLLVGARRDAVRGRGVDQHLVLGREGRGRVLVDHHPGVDARRRRQERRQPAVEPRVEEQRGPSLADRAELSERQLREVESEGDRLAVEVATADDSSAACRQCRRIGHTAAREDERVVGRGVELDVEDAAEVVERVPDGAVDLRDAAQRVRVLDLVVVAWWPAWRPLSRRRWRSSAATATWPGMRAGRAGMRRRTRHRCRGAPRRSSPRSTLAVRPRRSASASSSAPIALIIWVPLRSASPSFGSSVSGSRPVSRKRDERGHHRPVELDLARAR